MGQEGGALPKLINLSRAGLGGKQGSGRQFVSWIHAEDYARITEQMISDENKKGTYNCVSPSPVSNQIFMKTLHKALRVPFSLPSPGWLLKLGAMIIGTEPELILKSRKVIPGRLAAEGFEFEFPLLESALHEILQKPLFRSS